MQERSKCLTAEYKEVKINQETGEVKEIISRRNCWVKKEPHYIKIYEGMQENFPLTKKIPHGVFSFLYHSMEGFNDSKNDFIIFRSNKHTQQQLAEYLEVKPRMARDYITRLKDAGVLFCTDLKGEYIVNPHFIARGDWQCIKKVQQYFTLQNNKWIYLKEIKEDLA